MKCSIIVSPVSGAVPEGHYHNYLWDGLSGTLHRLQDVLTGQGADWGARKELGDAADRLRGLAQQMMDVST